MAPVCAVAVLACLVVLAGCRHEPPYREELLVFGGPASIEIRGVDADRARDAVAQVAARLNAREREWHPWQPGPLVELNRAFAEGRAGTAPPSLHALLRHARRWQARSDGLFDPAVGGLVALWGFHTGDYPLTTPPPTDARIRRWLQARPTVDDVIELADGRLRSRNVQLQLDFNAIAEGAVAAEAAAVLGSAGVADALLVFGGDVFALGTADGRAWRVAIRDPRPGQTGSASDGGAGEDVLAEVELQGREALFTSGDYGKFRVAADGTRWPHTLDPRSGRPSTGTSAVSVLHADPVRADAAATALLIGGATRFAELIERLGTPCALLLTDDDSLLLTRAMQQRVTLHRAPRHRAPVVSTDAGCMQ